MLTPYEKLADEVCPKGVKRTKPETRRRVIEVIKKTVNEDKAANNYHLLSSLALAVGMFISWHDGEESIEKHKQLFKEMEVAYNRLKEATKG